eukprot:CAMPEP_0179120304 /NCGR_PEP_ID=MMETSP0796-20121207/56675_1 /TAXON_ID=73915 /ORGANISM="Pyrodinium bahamense, Strain pbaha01" /LENGTH=76 /DNA_ID=CAMNT_0020818839 /DNA_START=207 /DNA_END=434 /DNA_ORIENTATION=-
MATPTFLCVGLLCAFGHPPGKGIHRDMVQYLRRLCGFVRFEQGTDIACPGPFEGWATGSGPVGRVPLALAFLALAL